MISNKSNFRENLQFLVDITGVTTLTSLFLAGIIGIPIYIANKSDIDKQKTLQVTKYDTLIDTSLMRSFENGIVARDVQINKNLHTFVDSNYDLTLDKVITYRDGKRNEIIGKDTLDYQLLFRRALNQKFEKATTPYVHWEDVISESSGYQATLVDTISREPILYYVHSRSGQPTWYSPEEWNELNQPKGL